MGQSGGAVGNKWPARNVYSREMRVPLIFRIPDLVIRNGTGFILRDSMETMLERLGRFRHLYPPRRVRCGAAEWEYFAGGKGIECLLLLHGGSGSGEMYFEYFSILQTHFD